QIPTVIDNPFKAHLRISVQITAQGSIFNSLFHHMNKVSRNGAAENVVHELEFRASRQRFHFNLAVAILTMAASLLLVTALNVGASANGLAIRNLGRL